VFALGLWEAAMHYNLYNLFTATVPAQHSVGATTTASEK